MPAGAQRPVHDRDIDAIDVVRGELRLQAIAGVRILREDEHAGGVAIEAVDVVHSRLAAASTEICVEDRLGGLVTHLRAGDGQKPFGLVDADQIPSSNRIRMRGSSRRLSRDLDR